MKKIILLFVTILVTASFFGQENHKNTYLFSGIINQNCIQPSNDLFDFEDQLDAYISYKLKSAEDPLDMTHCSERITILDSVLYYQYELNGDSICHRKSVYSRNNLGNLTEVISYDWMPAPGSWALSDKTEYLFDENDQLLEYMYSFWDGSDWAYDYMRIYDYDIHHNQILNAYFKWDISSNDWLGSSKYEYSYNAEGFRLLMAYYIWDVELNDWKGTNKNESTYDEDGLLIVSYEYLWGAENDWQVQYKNDYTYDEDDNQITVFTYLMAEDDWELYGKRENSFDENGNRVLSYYLLWENNNVWVNNRKSVFAYDGTGNRILSEYYFWNNDSWSGIYKLVLEYDENSKLLFYIKYGWENQIADWLPDEKSVFTYDNNGYENSYTAYNWDLALAQWIPTFKDEFDSDEEGNYLTYASFSWDLVMNDWLLDEKSFSYYSDFFITQAELTKIDMKVYPNPITSNVTMVLGLSSKDIVKIEIVDIRGRLVNEIAPKTYSPGENKLNVNTSAFTPGIYFYRISTENKTMTGKLIKM